MPQFFDRYINLAKDNVDLVTQLEETRQLLYSAEVQQFEKLKDKIYAPGKWTVNDILQHIIDNERIQVYRAMRIARNDKTVLPGYDENLLAASTMANKRTFEDMITELDIVRQASIHLFKNLDEQMLQQRGICFKVEISPLALGFVLVGHQIHHFNVIKERYLPLI